VRVYDRQEDQIRDIPNGYCGFSYRTSLFKSGRPESLSRRRGLPPQAAASQARGARRDIPRRGSRVSHRSGTPSSRRTWRRMGEQAGVGEVRAAVLKIRARKGMC